jgi:hypothetical protein
MKSLIKKAVSVYVGSAYSLESELDDSTNIYYINLAGVE